MPEYFYLLIDHPALIAAPIIVFAALALWSHSRTAWLATAAWVVYLGYELGMNAALLCSGNECMKRTPLYVVYPLLAFLSLVALVQVYVHIRDKRDRRAGNPTPHADSVERAGSQDAGLSARAGSQRHRCTFCAIECKRP